MSELKPGDQAPDFTRPADGGGTLSLKQFRGKPVILYFYPKDDTPGCTTEACGFRDAWHELSQAGVVVLGVSRDSVRSHRKFADKYGLPFTLLSDEGGKVADQYGVWIEKSMYGKNYMSMARTTFYIRPNGKIGHVWTQVRAEGHAQSILDYLEKV